MKGNSGSILLEAIISLSLIIGLVSGTLVLSASAFARLWFDHLLYEGLICVAEGRSRRTCEHRLLAQVHRTLRYGEIKKIVLISSNNLQKGELNWSGAGMELKLRKSLQIP